MATENCTSGWISASIGRRRILESPISDLEDDILVEILIRLPNPRYSCRCKSVCKRWSSLISSPHFNRRFISHHRSRNEQESPMFLTNHDPQLIIDSVLPAVPADEEDQPRFIVWDFYKDLVLCGFTDPGFRDAELSRSYIICNPFTKQWIALPLAPEKTAGYIAASGRLVGQPCISATVNLDLGDGQSFAYSFEHRFKVVCMYTHVYSIGRPYWDIQYSIRLDVFCSESRKWRKEALVLDETLALMDNRLLSYNGKLFLSYFRYHISESRTLLAAIDPFRLDLPPTHYVDASVMLEENNIWKFVISQDALHLVIFEHDYATGCLTVWRLEEDGKSWRKRFEGLLNTTSSWGKYKLDRFFIAALHPEKPEIVFLEYGEPHHEERTGIYSYDLTRSGGEVEFFAEIRRLVPYWKVLQPRVSCWPTLIPRYKELRGMYDGSYDCWAQNSEAITPLHQL